MRMDILGYVEIESRIVDEYKCVGLPLHNVALALCHIAEDGGQMHKYGHKAHICQLTIVTHTYSSDIRHLVAAEESELGGIVYTAQGKRKELLTIKYHGTQNVKVNGKNIPCYHITFMFTSDGRTKTSDDMSAWIATDSRIPLKLEGKLKVGKVQCFYTGRI